MVKREKFESHHNSATAGIVAAVPQLFLIVAPITAEDVSPLSTAARGIRDTLLLIIARLMLTRYTRGDGAWVRQHGWTLIGNTKHSTVVHPYPWNALGDLCIFVMT